MWESIHGRENSSSFYLFWLLLLGVNSSIPTVGSMFMPVVMTEPICPSPMTIRPMSRCFSDEPGPGHVPSLA